jgi:hypothetical protein
MNRIEQESLAGKTQSSHSQAGYDCELPPDIRTELLGPRRPPIQQVANRPNLVKSQPRGPLYFVLIVGAVVLGGAITTLWRQRNASSSARREHISPPTLAPQPTPAPIVTSPGSASRWSHSRRVLLEPAGSTREARACI